MKKKKALFVAGRPPYPLDTGAKIRSWHILVSLCRKYDVDVLCYREHEDSSSWNEAAKKIGVGRLEEIDNCELNYQISFLMFISAMMRRLPVTVTKYQTKAMTEMFQEFLRSRYDIVHIEHVHLAGLLQYVTDSGIVCSLDAHNVETQIARRMCRLESSLLRKMALAIHAWNMNTFEKYAFSHSDFIMAVSCEDADSIKTMSAAGPQRVSLVENGVDIEYFTPARTAGITPTASKSDATDETLVFVGSMDWLPNIDGVRWFVEETFPLIRKQKPYCRLSIVGRNPHPSIKALNDPEEGVVVTGTVDDVRTFVREASVAVVPLRYGGGTRLKILEAFAMGIPVVSTALGSEGITYENGKHLLLAETPSEIAEACILLMDNEKKAGEISRAARQLVCKKYSWDAITEKMLTTLDGICEMKMQSLTQC